MTISVRQYLAQGLQERLNIGYTDALAHVNTHLDSGWELPPRDPDVGWTPAIDVLAESYPRDDPEATR